MLWEIELHPKVDNPELLRVRREYEWLAASRRLPRCEDSPIMQATRGYLVEGVVDRAQVELLTQELLVDPVVEEAVVGTLGDGSGTEERSAQGESADEGTTTWTVLLKPGVMDPVAQSVQEAAGDLEVLLTSVRTYRRYRVDPSKSADQAVRDCLRRVLANDAIETVHIGRLQIEHLTLGRRYEFQRIEVPLLDLSDEELIQLSRRGQLALNLDEMRAIQQHYRSLGRNPTDVELETLAQTWSEHCSHKTLKGAIQIGDRRYDNLLRETIFQATQEIRSRLGDDDWCVSVFEDNAGIVRFDDEYNVCFKVETHNHPSAIEPYGGANTGIGGVIRDVLGTGLGAKPVCNTDVFCFAPPFASATGTEVELPPGVQHPARVMSGVVAGVRDYGNRMGIPTVNGAVFFDGRYLGNPLVFCGTVGIIPRDCCRKRPQPGDLIVVLGGRTGRDGIHGATFSSLELTSSSEEESGGAVQIGNAITEKKLTDVLLQARDRELYHAITDCGAGGFSSAVGEMAAELGAKVFLEKAPLKYEGLSYTEIWISESQERMVLAVPPDRWTELEELCQGESVEAAVIGHFESSGRLRLYYQQNEVADLDLAFMHEGRPKVRLQAHWDPPADGETPTLDGRVDPHETLLAILSDYNVCSKEWIIRQYDHEVQGGSAVKPLVGANADGPSDAAVVLPRLDSSRALAVGCGICPQFGDLDPYRMAAAAIDEAVRNVVAVGADPARIALLDNFCWGNTQRPEVLGSLVLAAEACRDVALSYGTPFISGKDSLNNEFHYEDQHLIIPPTLLISALGQLPDVRRAVTMDFKAPGNRIYLIGETRDELGGSHLLKVLDIEGGTVPMPDLGRAPMVFRAVFDAIQRGLVRSCHDLSEGGLAVAVAEMAFAGDVGAEIDALPEVDSVNPVIAALFAESTTRFVVEVSEEDAREFEQVLGDDVPWQCIGRTIAEPRLRVVRGGEELLSVSCAELKDAWQRPLRPFQYQDG